MIVLHVGTSYSCTAVAIAGRNPTQLPGSAASSQHAMPPGRLIVNFSYSTYGRPRNLM